MRVLSVLFCLLALPASADVFGFATPSGNIQCFVGLGQNSADITCTIVERSSPDARPRPANCGATWGHVFTLFDTGPVQMECSERPRRFNMSDIAPYGETGQFNQITCRSERTGFECRNASGHGFFLSRRRQSVF